jgi:hypothetical protein
MADWPDPLCGHPREKLRRRGYRLRCARCGSFWDREFMDRAYAYDARYPEQRGHFQPRTGELKVRSLEGWLAAAALDPSHRVVCEVGFGGGHCLRYLADRAAHACGIEEIPENVERARSLGIQDVGPFEPLRTPAHPVDLWVFLDSFEHLPEPEAFLRWMSGASAPGAAALVVAPEAGSTSERLLGPLWPHRIADHRFHWSRAGIRELFGRHGFSLEREFHPRKSFSAATALRHLTHKFPGLAGLGRVATRLDGFTLAGNLGEMGLVFRKAG